MIGREIVQTLQAGEARAQYGNAVIADLATRLTERYGRSAMTLIPAKPGNALLGTQQFAPQAVKRER